MSLLHLFLIWLTFDSPSLSRAERYSRYPTSDSLEGMWPAIDVFLTLCKGVISLFMVYFSVTSTYFTCTWIILRSLFFGAVDRIFSSLLVSLTSLPLLCHRTTHPRMGGRGLLFMVLWMLFVGRAVLPSVPPTVMVSVLLPPPTESLQFCWLSSHRILIVNVRLIHQWVSFTIHIVGISAPTISTVRCFARGGWSLKVFELVTLDITLIKPRSAIELCPEWWISPIGTTSRFGKLSPWPANHVSDSMARSP